jgi:hypothetical protein
MFEPFILTNTNTATRNRKIKLALSKVPSSIRGLDDHLLASDRS